MTYLIYYRQDKLQLHYHLHFHLLDTIQLVHKIIIQVHGVFAAEHFKLNGTVFKRTQDTELERTFARILSGHSLYFIHDDTTSLPEGGTIKLYVIARRYDEAIPLKNDKIASCLAMTVVSRRMTISLRASR